MLTNYGKNVNIFTKHFNLVKFWEKSKYTCSNYMELNLKEKISNYGIQINKCAFPLNMDLN